jgi:glutathione peroxidase
MKHMFLLLSIAAIAAIALTAWTLTKGKTTYSPQTPVQSFYDLQATTLEGEPFDFNQLKGKRVLIVNTASKCGFTPQYEGLEALYQAHKGDDFVILGFPCNDFGKQEPGSADEIGAFCQRNYGVSFQMMEKVAVKGDEQHPVYAWLCNANLNGVGDHSVKWNFHKFLVDANGQLVASMRSAVKPDDNAIVAFASGK